MFEYFEYYKSKLAVIHPVLPLIVEKEVMKVTEIVEVIMKEILEQKNQFPFGIGIGALVNMINKGLIIHKPKQVQYYYIFGYASKMSGKFFIFCSSS